MVFVQVVLLVSSVAGDTFTHFPKTMGMSDTITRYKTVVAPTGRPGLEEDGDKNGAEALIAFVDGDTDQQRGRIKRKNVGVSYKPWERTQGNMNPHQSRVGEKKKHRILMGRRNVEKSVNTKEVDGSTEEKSKRIR